MGYKYDVFISYSRRDYSIADRIVSAFNTGNISYYRDQQSFDYSSNYLQSIIKIIDSCRVFLCVLSENAYSSEYVIKELEYALHGKGDSIVFPVIVDNSQLPNTLVPSLYNINIANWQFAGNQDIENTIIREIGNTIREHDEPNEQYISTEVKRLTTIISTDNKIIDVSVKRNKIFVSYSRLDANIVHPFINMIENHLKTRCWIDLKGIETGSQFEDKIIGAIDNCEIVLFMLSENSIKSEWTKREVYYAESEKKKIVPIVFDKGGLRGWFKFHFGSIDFIDANKSEHVSKLINDLKTWLNMDLAVLHPVKINDLYGLADDDQDVIVKGTWLSIGQFHNSIAFAQSVGGRYGMINHFGEVVIPYQWIHVEDFYEGIAKVQDENKKYGFVNSKGGIISNCIWDHAEHFSEGLACVISAKESGFIDCTGEIVIPYNEGNMTSFSEGLACVSDKNGKWGYINKKGDIIIPYTWEKASPFHTGLARVISKDLYGYINKNGEYEIPLEWSDSELIPVQDFETNLWGYINSKGKIIIPCEWVSARPFREGLARVEKNGVYGFIDRSGALVIPRRFLEAGDFKDGYAEIRDCVETRCSFVDKKGNLI